MAHSLTIRYPLKVTKSMGKKKVARRSKVKPFIKVVNYAHLLPTRYQLELESLKGSVSTDTFKEPTQREDSKKAIKKAFEERYAKGTNRWCEWDFESRPQGMLTYSLHQVEVLSGSRGFLRSVEVCRSIAPIHCMTKFRNGDILLMAVC